MEGGESTDLCYLLNRGVHAVMELFSIEFS